MEKNNYWSEKKESIRVNCKLPDCSASKYYKPEINSVFTKIESDDIYFIPKYENSTSSCADIFANIPDKSCSAVAQFSHCLIDCGFSIKISSGYKICFELDPLWSNKGLMLVGSSYIDPDILQRLKLNVLNLGQNQIIINNKDKIGKIWIEPIYFFDWN